MLTIRQSQISLLEDRSLASYVDRMLAYVEREYPDQFAAMGTEGTRSFVRQQIEAARAKSIRSEGAVSVYIDLVLLYGEDLRLGPDRTWVQNTLKHATLPDYIRVAAVRDRLAERTGGRRIIAAANHPS